MALEYAAMTAAQKAEFMRVSNVSEKIRAARAGIGLDLLAQDEKATVRVNAAMSEEAAPEVLARLANDEDSRVRAAALGNPAVPESTLLEAIETGRPETVNIAQNPGMTEAVSVALMKDGQPAVLKLLAGNPATPPDVLVVLSSRGECLAALAANPSTPELVFAKIAEFSDSSARRKLAQRDGLPAEVMKSLSADTNFEVRRAVAARLDLPMEVVGLLERDKSTAVLEALAANESTPQSVLESLSRNAELVQAIAANPSSPDEALKEVYRLTAEYTYSTARARLAANPSTPPFLLDRIALGLDEISREAALMNPSCELATISAACESPNCTEADRLIAVKALVENHGYSAKDAADFLPRLPLDKLIEVAGANTREQVSGGRGARVSAPDKPAKQAEPDMAKDIEMAKGARSEPAVSKNQTKARL